ncbi:MAG: protein kinase, partial [Myxococcota bacterium]|nr:protein kinase [Myxococcota bacterium]
MATSGAVTFDNILDDLEGILQTLQDTPNLSYGSLQERLTWKPHLHLINYIRFLEQQGWVDYDRISDNLALTGDGDAALDDVDSWSDLAHDAFESHISIPDSTDPEQDSLGYDDYDDDDGAPTSVLSSADMDGVLDLTADVEFIEESHSELAPSTDPEADEEGLYEDSIPDEVYSDAGSYEEPGAFEPVEDVFEHTQEEPEAVAEHAFDAPSEPEPEPAPAAFTREPEPAQPYASKSEPQPSRASEPRATERYSRATSEEGRKPMSTSSYQSTSSQSSSEGLYNREEEVGSGGIGTVYRGVQTRLARPVAIKEIRNIFHVFADVQRDDIIRRFVEIVQTQASLDHPNIIQIYDVISDADYPYVVMQYAPKGNLRNLIDTEGRPPLNVAMSYFMQILHALNSAHEQGIVHGGLKPETDALDP